MAEFELTIPVLIDPVGETVRYFDQGQTPLNLIMDRDGKALGSETGKPNDIQAIIEAHIP